MHPIKYYIIPPANTTHTLKLAFALYSNARVCMRKKIFLIAILLCSHFFFHCYFYSINNFRFPFILLVVVAICTYGDSVIFVYSPRAFFLLFIVRPHFITAFWIIFFYLLHVNKMGLVR